MPPSSEAGLTYDRNAVIRIRKGYVGFGLSAADHERIPPVAFAEQAARPAGEMSAQARKRGNIRAKLSRLVPRAVPVPSLFLANVQSQETCSWGSLSNRKAETAGHTSSQRHGLPLKFWIKLFNLTFSQDGGGGSWSCPGVPGVYAYVI